MNNTISASLDTSLDISYNFYFDTETLRGYIINNAQVNILKYELENLSYSNNKQISICRMKKKMEIEKTIINIIISLSYWMMKQSVIKEYDKNYTITNFKYKYNRVGERKPLINCIESNSNCIGCFSNNEIAEVVVYAKLHQIQN